MRQRTKLTALAFALSLVVTVAGYILFLPGPDRGYQLSAHLPDITGITLESGVEMSGKRVGVVERIFLNDGDAHIDIQLMPGVTLYEDAAIGKRAGCRAGEDCVVLIQGTEGNSMIPDGGKISKITAAP